MICFKSIRVFVFTITVVGADLEFRPDIYFAKTDENCNKLARDPYFDADMVVGKPWRIYFSWFMKLDDKCMDMTFKNATPAITHRIFNDMYEYLESQPFWDAAALLVTMGQSHHEMLLFTDQGATGRFVGVPNVMRDGNISPNKNAVPLFKIHMKLLFEGKYLIMSDCNIGVTTLSARKDLGLYRAEIAGVAHMLDFGEGFAACVSDDNSEEKLGKEEIII